MEAAFLALSGRAAFLCWVLPAIPAGILPLYVAVIERLFLGLNVALLFVTEK